MKVLFKRIHILFLLAAIHLLPMAAAEPDWECNIHDYQYDMTVFASLNIEGRTVSPEQYTLAAFCGDECRGIATVENSEAAPYYYLRIRSNSINGEAITFRAYDKAADKEVDTAWLQTTITFEANERMGYPSSPFVIEFKDSTVYYTVTVLGSLNGTVTGGGTVEAGQEMTLSAIPDEGYVFSGWTDGSQANPYTFQVVGNKEIGAYFSPRKYQVSYVIDGEIIDTDSVAYQAAIMVPEPPSKEGHSFSGWYDVPETMPAQDIEINGSYIVNIYAIRYYVDSLEYYTDSVAYGENIILINEPTKAGYKFSGWSEVPEVMPAHDVRVDGYFDVTVGVVNLILQKTDMVNIYSVRGELIYRNVPYYGITDKLTHGVYIINGKKVFIRK